MKWYKIRWLATSCELIRISYTTLVYCREDRIIV